MNFCFWSYRYGTKFKINGKSGNGVLFEAINRAIREGIDITNPNFYIKLNLDQLKRIFRPDSGTKEIPMLAERLKCLHEHGRILLEKYEGNFANAIKMCENSAEKLLKLIVEDFVYFRDEAVFNGKTVSMYKKAQVLIADIWTCFQGKTLGCFNDFDDIITMFADYRVPQVLVHFRALSYDKKLMDLLRKGNSL